MLILPLHKPLSRANFPLVTMLVVLVNVMVFFGCQAGDDHAIEEAQRYYLSSGLGGYEAPAYERYLRESGRDKELAELGNVPEAERPQFVGRETLDDVAFKRALEQGGLFAGSEVAQAWWPLRARYDAMLGESFTMRHVMRSSEWAPARMLSAAFLHGGVMHLIGNMLFLVALGVLLEGAIGRWRFLCVYLLGAFGASAASLWWRWGEAGGGLGASGAIAALMGAFCLVWGRRPVRFFYWFGVVFDYVRAPAIWLFPLWLGWEIYNLLANADAGIGFDAHAGGLVTGALLGALLVATRQTRGDFMNEDEDEAAHDDRWERAQRHMGRLENREAERLLAELAAEQPQRFDVARARYRIARNSGDAKAVGQRGLELLRLPAPDTHEAQAQFIALRELADEGIVVDKALRETLIDHWLGLGRLREVEALLSQSDADMPREEQAQHWFRLALRHGEQHAGDERQRLLCRLIERYPEQRQAEKARFLLEHGQA